MQIFGLNLKKWWKVRSQLKTKERREKRKAKQEART
jgi:hypothetical protein